MGEILIRYAQTAADARSALDEGFEPVECSFGRDGSVVCPLQMDHHGALSHLSGVALRGHGESWGARRDDPRFVVVGDADADATARIVGLAGILRLEPETASLINEVDIRGPEVGSLVE